MLARKSGAGHQAGQPDGFLGQGAGTAALNVTGEARIAQISCPAAGYCTTGGLFDDKAGKNESFVAGESKGK